MPGSGRWSATRGTRRCASTPVPTFTAGTPRSRSPPDPGRAGRAPAGPAGGALSGAVVAGPGGLRAGLRGRGDGRHAAAPTPYGGPVKSAAVYTAGRVLVFAVLAALLWLVGLRG